MCDMYVFFVIGLEVYSIHSFARMPVFACVDVEPCSCLQEQDELEAAAKP